MPTTLFGTPFDDLIFAGVQGNQSLTDVTVYAGDGDDTIFGSQGNDTLYAGNGSDVVFSGIGADAVHLEGGDDTIRLGVEVGNTVTGGTGIDTIVHFLPSSANIVSVEFDFASGEQINNQDSLHWNQLTDFENYMLTGAATDARISGNEMANEISVGAGNDELLGQGGNDTVTGGEGSDLIFGGDGHDLLFGDGFVSVPPEFDLL